MERLIGTQSYGHDLANSAAFDTFVGTGENGNAWFFQGLLDDVRIYDGAISAQQASNLFQFGQLQIPEPGSIAVWSVVGLGLSLFGLMRRRVK